jgi:predicted permease
MGWLSRLFHRRRQDAQLDSELRFHIEQQTADNIAAGMPPDEARRRALAEFGGLEYIKEETRDARGTHFVESLLQDIRYAFRTLRKSPGFVAITILTLALGIGANTAIFSFIDAVVLRSLPVQDPQQLVLFTWTAHHTPKYDSYSGGGDCQERINCSLSAPFFEVVRAQIDSFSGMAAFGAPIDIDFSGNGAASVARGTYVSGDYFSVLGVNMLLGRPLGPSDQSRSAPPAIVLSYGYWRRAFGGDRSVLGRTVHLNTVPVTIVGVAEPRFTNLTPGAPQDFFMPLSIVNRVRSEWWTGADRLTDPAAWWVVILGRLKPGASFAQAQAAATMIFRNEMLRGTKPLSTEADAPAIKLLPAAQGLNGISKQSAPGLYVTMVIVAFILLIACANVAGLALARSATRQKEMAVRLALGAGRARIARQLLTESVLLSVAGGAVGVLVAVWGIYAMTKLIASGTGEPFNFVVAPDWPVLVFTIGITFATGLLFGLAPALRSARVDLTPALKGNSSSLPGSGARTGHFFRLGDALVVAQVALSIVVLIGAGLFVRTLRNLHNLNPGFDAHDILLFGIDPSVTGYNDPQTAQLYRNLQQHFAALPGVISASYSEDALLSGDISGYDVHIDSAPPKSNVNTETLNVSANFFSTMRIPLLAGRNFTPADFAAAAATHAAQKAAEAALEAAARATSVAPNPPAAPASSAAQPPAVPVLINETFARKYFPNQNPLGKHIGNAQEDDIPASYPQPGFVIMGIVGDTKYDKLRREIAPTMYLPLVSNSAHFELRAAANPQALIPAVRQIVSRADDNLPLTDVLTQSEQIDQMLFQERLMSQLSSFFGTLALVLASIGLYGLLSYEVARRTRELGIRMALGAQHRDLLSLVIGQGILLTLIGAAIGIASALGATRFISNMLFGIRANDPLTMVAVTILLILVALAACYIPARRAMRVDPIVALKYE